MNFDFNKLRGRVREILGSEAELARQLGLQRSALSARFKGTTPFTIKEIAQAAEVLKIERSDIGLYFFTPCDEIISEPADDIEAIFNALPCRLEY